MEKRLGIRVNLTLPVELVDVLDRLGKATGAGRATIIREWLTESLPALRQLVVAVELASQKNIDAFKVVSETLREVTQQAEQVQLDLQVKRRAAMRKRIK